MGVVVRRRHVIVSVPASRRVCQAGMIVIVMPVIVRVLVPVLVLVLDSLVPVNVCMALKSKEADARTEQQSRPQVDEGKRFPEKQN
jgi:hypothetical protein